MLRAHIMSGTELDTGDTPIVKSAMVPYAFMKILC